MLMVPKSPWLFCYTYPTEKKSTRKRAELDERNLRAEPGPNGGSFPVPYVLRVTERKRLFFFFFQERGGKK